MNVCYSYSWTTGLCCFPQFLIPCKYSTISWTLAIQIIWDGYTWYHTHSVQGNTHVSFLAGLIQMNVYIPYLYIFFFLFIHTHAGPYIHTFICLPTFTGFCQTPQNDIFKMKNHDSSASDPSIWASPNAAEVFGHLSRWIFMCQGPSNNGKTLW